VVAGRSPQLSCLLAVYSMHATYWDGLAASTGTVHRILYETNVDEFLVNHFTVHMLDKKLDNSKS
jgi:hypothetical protein